MTRLIDVDPYLSPSREPIDCRYDEPEPDEDVVLFEAAEAAWLARRAVELAVEVDAAVVADAAEAVAA